MGDVFFPYTYRLGVGARAKKKKKWTIILVLLALLPLLPLLPPLVARMACCDRC
jgi:hypothetical protein